MKDSKGKADVQSDEGSGSTDRPGLHEILGYGAAATRIINLLVTAGLGTPSWLREATYSDLLDIPHFGEKLLDHVIACLDYVGPPGRER